MTEFEVPQAARSAAARYAATERDEAIRAIAAPVVAAELRRLADELNATGRADVGRHVRSRADQLDGGAS